MKKNQIIGIIVAVVLILGGIIGWAFFQKLKLPLKEKVAPTEKIITEEVYSLSGIVSKVDAENNFLTVMPTGKEKEVKVIIGEDTKLFKVLYPFEKGKAEFVTKRKEITIEDIKKRDNVFIKTNINIAGLKEFNNVDYVEVL